MLSKETLMLSKSIKKGVNNGRSHLWRNNYWHNFIYILENIRVKKGCVTT